MQKEDKQMQADIGDIGMARTQPRLEIATPYKMIITAHGQVDRSDSIERTSKEVWREKSVDEDWSGKGVVVGLGRQIQKQEWQWPTPFNIHPRQCVPSPSCAL